MAIQKLQLARNSPKFFDANAVRRPSRINSPKRFTGLGRAPRTSRATLYVPSGKRAAPKSFINVSSARSLTTRTQWKGIPNSSAARATPPASISTTDAPASRKVRFSCAVDTIWSTLSSTIWRESFVPLRTGVRTPSERTSETWTTSPTSSCRSNAPQNPILHTELTGEIDFTPWYARCEPAPFAIAITLRPFHLPSRAQWTGTSIWCA